MPKIAKQEIETERLLLRPLSSADRNRIETLLTDKRVSHWLTSIAHPFSRDDALAFVSDAKRSWADGADYVFAIVPIAEDQMCGEIRIGSVNGRDTDIGYFLGANYWGRGYASEAALALVDWGFATLSLEQIRARHFAGNNASARVLQKCGFTYTGERETIFSKSRGEEVENLWMVLTRAARELDKGALEWRTERLTLRPVRETDCDAIQTLASNFEIARWLSTMPHPYPEDGAVRFLEQHARTWADGTNYGIAMEVTATGEFVGILGLMYEDAAFWEVGYWLGQPYWRNGYTTEALGGLLAWGFETFGMTQVRARCFEGNERSARVLSKCGFKPTGETIITFAHSLDREVTCNWMSLSRSDGGRDAACR